jgi:hypothetical protein
MGILDVVWDVDGMKDEYTGNGSGSQSRFFDRGDRKRRCLKLNWARRFLDNPR